MAKRVALPGLSYRRGCESQINSVLLPAFIHFLFHAASSSFIYLSPRCTASAFSAHGRSLPLGDVTRPLPFPSRSHYSPGGEMADALWGVQNNNMCLFPVFLTSFSQTVFEYKAPTDSTHPNMLKSFLSVGHGYNEETSAPAEGFISLCSWVKEPEQVQ